LASSYELFKSIPERESSQNVASNTIAIGRSPLTGGSQSRISRAQFTRTRDEESTMASATVKCFNPTKGYGFIQPRSVGKDVLAGVAAGNCRSRE
jgi:hypothetical protein